MDQALSDLLKWLIEHLENRNDRLAELASRISSLEQTLMATTQEQLAAIAAINTGLDNVNEDITNVLEEIEALKAQVAAGDADSNQVLAGLTSLQDRVTTMSGRVPDKVPVPPVEEPPAA